MNLLEQFRFVCVQLSLFFYPETATLMTFRSFFFIWFSSDLSGPFHYLHHPPLERLSIASINIYIIFLPIKTLNFRWGTSTSNLNRQSIPFFIISCNAYQVPSLDASCSCWPHQPLSLYISTCLRVQYKFWTKTSTLLRSLTKMGIQASSYDQIWWSDIPFDSP